MSEFKEYPTQEEYDGNPEYYRDFERRLEKTRDELMHKVYEAIHEQNTNWLANQFMIMAAYQAKLEGACLTGDYPQWQKREMLELILVYHDVMKEIGEVLERVGFQQGGIER